MQKWKGRKDSAELSSDLQVQEPHVRALQEWWLHLEREVEVYYTRERN